MSELENWLQSATRCLARDSRAQVRGEIREHYELAHEAAMSGGATADEAERVAVKALGDAKTANRQYRQCLLTSAEAKLLSDAKWESRAVCSRGWLKRLLQVMPVAGIAAAITLFAIGENGLGRIALAFTLGTGVLTAATILPVYTPSRGLVFRYVKWAVLIVAMALAFGPDTLKFSWLILPCLWHAVWMEWRRASIRRKLPVGEWPKPLYL